MKHITGKKITDEELEKAAMMFSHMNGSAISRCRWIARRMRKAIASTWLKRIKEFNEALQEVSA